MLSASGDLKKKLLLYYFFKFAKANFYLFFLIYFSHLDHYLALFAFVQCQLLAGCFNSIFNNLYFTMFDIYLFLPEILQSKNSCPQSWWKSFIFQV